MLRVRTVNTIRSHARNVAGVFALALSLIVVYDAAAGAAQRRDRTMTQIGTSMQGLQRYSTSHSLDDLNATVQTLVSVVDIPLISPRHYLARRRAIVRAWAQVLRTIELSYDPTFDPNDPKNRPFICVSPPREASGRILMPCADPNDVEDPQARAAYIAAIERNQQKRERAYFQMRLRNIDDAAMLGLKFNLASFRRVAPPDSTALDAILRESGINDERRAKIDALL